MALNPSFNTPTKSKLPFAVGYVLGQGTTVLSITTSDGSQLILNLLGEGEWDGPALANTFASSAVTTGLEPTPQVVSHLIRNSADAPSVLSSLSSVLHFHSGSFATKGAGNQMTSQGSGLYSDQSIDEWFADFPGFIPPQRYSGIAYAIWRTPPVASYPGFVFPEMTISGVAVWRTTRCRIFDAYGNVTAYQFTCNPAWQKVEAILRYKIRSQQPGLAGLTDAEKACFNWPSIVELAARNDFILPNGNPRFVGNHIWAADATLTSILEALCRDDRSFIRVQNGQIYMIGNDSRTSVFHCSANHVVPESVKLQKKDISKAPNVFVPQFRDLGIPAVAQVVTATELSLGDMAFELSTLSPFLSGGVVTYGGSSNPLLDRDYSAITPSSTDPNSFQSAFAFVSIGNGTGGYVGSNDARFSQRAPRTVQHRSAQRMTLQQAPGLALQPRIAPVFYDCGASTYDQTNRLMKFERDSSLGTDTGVGWTAPITGSLTAYLEAVDANGRALIECGVHDVITLDDWVFPERPGDYEIMELEIAAPTSDDLGSITLQLRQYNPSAATDVSDPPGDSYQNVPNDGLQLSGFTPLVNPAWTLQATPLATIEDDVNLTITVPDLILQVMGIPTSTAYPTSSWTLVPNGTQAYLYVTDSTGIGSSPTFQTRVGAPIDSPGVGQMLALSGVFTMPSGGGSGPVAAIYSPSWPITGPPPTGGPH